MTNLDKLGNKSAEVSAEMEYLIKEIDEQTLTLEDFSRAIDDQKLKMTDWIRIAEDIQGEMNMKAEQKLDMDEEDISIIENEDRRRRINLNIHL